MICVDASTVIWATNVSKSSFPGIACTFHASAQSLGTLSLTSLATGCRRLSWVSLLATNNGEQNVYRSHTSQWRELANLLQIFQGILRLANRHHQSLFIDTRKEMQSTTNILNRSPKSFCNFFALEQSIRSLALSSLQLACSSVLSSTCIVGSEHGFCRECKQATS